MYDAPTLEDFVDFISEPLEQAVLAAKKAAHAVEVQFAMRGSSGNSRTIHAMFDAIEAEFEKGLAAAFRRYQREEQRQIYEIEDIWKALEERLAQFLSDTQAIMSHEALKSKSYYRSMGAAIDAGHERLSQKMKRRLRHLRVGSWEGEETVSDLVILGGNYIHGNNNNVLSGSGNVAQQGTVGSHQTVEVKVEQLGAAIERLETALAATDVSEQPRSAIRDHVGKIRAELATPSPNPTVVKEAARSIRTIVEATVAGALVSPVGMIATELAKMVGL